MLNHGIGSGMVKFVSTGFLSAVARGVAQIKVRLPSAVEVALCELAGSGR